jgi:hypothetical protein
MGCNTGLKYFICFALFSVMNQITAEPFNVIIHAEQWDIPRHGETLIKQPELGKIVRQWALQATARIEIHYPGGEEGELWVQELMDWLVALGVPSEAILHSPGSGGEDIINLVLKPESR